jgi:hypothetical protein
MLMICMNGQVVAGLLIYMAAYISLDALIVEVLIPFLRVFLMNRLAVGAWSHLHVVSAMAPFALV